MMKRTVPTITVLLALVFCGTAAAASTLSMATAKRIAYNAQTRSLNALTDVVEKTRGETIACVRRSSSNVSCRYAIRVLVNAKDANGYPIRTWQACSYTMTVRLVRGVPRGTRPTKVCQ